MKIQHLTVCHIRHRTAGFTLIELMIAVAVIAILSAIAYPSYTQYIAKARRSDAHNLLLEAANNQELFLSNFNTYTTVVVAPGGCSGSACGLGYSSNTSLEGYYTLSVAAGGAGIGTSYVLTATRAAGAAQENDQCGDFTLTQTGVKGVTNASGGKTASDCW